jgi:L-threonylcarbamoyladenylate synthase
MSESARAFEECISRGGVAVFPSDTVYGLACDPDDAGAIERLYALKRRAPDKASAVMFFALDAALAALPEVGPRTRELLARLLPGAVTVLLPNPHHRFPLAAVADPGTLGLRVVAVAALAGVRLPVLQSSANLAGEPEARRLIDVEASIRAGADLTVDGGELPGVASTVLDLRRFETDGADAVRVIRAGAVPEGDVRAVLAAL